MKAPVGPGYNTSGSEVAQALTYDLGLSMWSPWQRSKLYYYNNSNRRTTLLQCLGLAISKVSLEEMVGGAQVSLDNWTFTFLVGVYLYIFGRCRTVPTRIQNVFQYQIQHDWKVSNFERVRFT